MKTKNFLSDESRRELGLRYAAGTSAKDLALAFNIDYSNVFDHLKRLGISVRGNTQKVNKCDTSVFNSINTPAKAYWLGFITADGNISVRGELIIVLAKKDEAHLEKFRCFISLVTPIKQINNNGYPGVKISIGSQQLCSALRVFGVVPKKSATIAFPTNVPVQLMNHFIRGYFDGDGSAFTSGKSHIPVISFVGNKAFIKQLGAFVRETVGVEIHTYPHTKSKIAHYLIIKGRVRVKRFTEWLYAGKGPCLLRKKKVVQTFRFD